jgi:hypothetical protein
VLPGVAALSLLLGRSSTTAVVLTGAHVYPTGIAVTLGVRVRGRIRRRELHAEVFDGPYAHDLDADWQRKRLMWGVELSDGRRVTTVDPPAWPGEDGFPDLTRPPERPVLVGGGGGGGSRSVERDYWWWPLPPAGPLRVVCQWLDQDIALTAHDLDAGPFRDAAARARPLWPDA